MKKIYLAILTILTFSCTEKVLDKQVNVPYLRVSNIYRSDSIKAFLTNYREDIAGYGKYYFNKALKDREKDIPNAIFYFKKSICYQPDNIEAYRELARLLAKENYENELSRLYDLFVFSDDKEGEEYYFEKYDEELYCDILENYSNRGNWFYISELSYYLNEKKVDTDKLLELMSERIKDSEKLAKFNFNFKQGYENDTKITESTEYYSEYIKQYTTTNFPINIDQKNIGNFNYSYSDSDYYVEMEYYYKYFTPDSVNNRYNQQFNYLYKIPYNNNFHTVVYAVDSSAHGVLKDMRHIYYRMVNYSKDSINILDSKIIAKQIGDTVTTAKITEKGVEINTYFRNWKNPYDKSDMDNEIKSIDFVESTMYQIDSTGKFVQENPELTQ